VDTVGFLGLGITLLCAGVIVFSLYTGRVPARCPVPALDRQEAPIGFWFTIFTYAVAAVAGALLATSFIG
jgi:hypothetical protein